MCMIRLFLILLISSLFNVYHDQNSMSDRTSGLKRILVVVILIFPLHALFYHRVGFWVIVFPIQEEKSRGDVLYSCRCVRISINHTSTIYSTILYKHVGKKNTIQCQIPKVCEVAFSSWISKCLAPLGISRTLRKPERKLTS